MDNELQTLRHTAAHILAQAVKRLYPQAKLAIGPAIENGFYYDIDMPVSVTPEVLAQLEAEMKKIAAENLRIERFTLPRDEALALMKDEPFKTELIQDLPEGEEISFYKQGEFTDLCARPACRVHKKAQGLQAHAGDGRLLARRQHKENAYAHLRHGICDQGGAGKLPRRRRRSQKARPQQARPSARPVYHLRGNRTGPADHPAEGHGRPAHPPALGGGRGGKARLSADKNAVYGQARTV